MTSNLVIMVVITIVNITIIIIAVSIITGKKASLLLLLL